MSRSKTVWMEPQHGCVGQPLAERLEGDLKLLAGQRLRAGAGLARRALAVRAGHALVRHARLHAAGRMDLRSR